MAKINNKVFIGTIDMIDETWSDIKADTANLNYVDAYLGLGKLKHEMATLKQLLVSATGRENVMTGIGHATQEDSPGHDSDWGC